MARLSKQRRQELSAGGGGSTGRTGPPSRSGAAPRRGAPPRSGSTPPRPGSAARPGTAPARSRARVVVPGRPWWQSPWAWGSGISAVVVAVIVIFIVVAASGPPASPDALAPATVVDPVTQVSPSTLAAVGAGGLSNPLIKLPSSTRALTGAGGKPLVMMFGEDSCPYCAFERWGVVVALSRFGTFSDLHVTSSSSSDYFPNTETFSFYGSTYTSAYVDFQGIEVADRDGKPLQTPTASQEKLLTSYDAAPYVTQSGNPLPFIDLGGRYLASGDPPLDYTVDGQSVTVAPELLEGLTALQIAESLGDTSNYQSKAILGDANYLTAALCELTGNQPGSVCGSSTITGLESKLG